MLKSMKGLSRLGSQQFNNLKMMQMLGATPRRNFRQVHDLHEVVYTSQAELQQRTAKYLEKTDKVYKPS